MRRDVGFYVEAEIAQVYKAYLSAAVNPPFERDCREEPFHTISFGVNYSFKYNMNGGSCNIHLMPYGTGTAVNMRFSIAQLVGARYEAYAEDLNKAMQRFLPVPIRHMSFNMDDFLRPQNQVTPQTYVQPIPQPQAAPQPGGNACKKCGQSLIPGARFCSACGTPASAGKTCPNCNAPADDKSLFCTNCGTRL